MNELNVFAVADPHLGHESIVHHAKRPFADVEENDETVISRWNAVVPKKNSLVRIAGDYAWKDHMRYFHRLNGKKELIIGSHDHMSQSCYDTFTDVKDMKMFKWNGKFFFMIHCCPRVWERSHYGVPCLFGHSHGRLKTWNLSFDVGVDTKLSNFAPIPMEVIDKEVKRRYDMMDAAGRIVLENGKKLFRQDDVFYMLTKLERSEYVKMMDISDKWDIEHDESIQED